MEKKINPAEPLLAKIKVGPDKLKIGARVSLFPKQKKDYLREYLRQSKSA